MKEGLTQVSSVAYDGPSLFETLLGFNGTGTALAHSAVSIGSILFNGVPDDAGIEWYLEDLGGWDSPEVRSSSTPRPEDDGVYVGTFRHGGRLLDVKGRAVAPSVALAFHAKNRLFVELDVRNEVEVVVTEDLARRVVAKRVGRVLLAQRSRVLDFSVLLQAPDPRKYAYLETVVSGAAGVDLVFENEGTVATRATAVVTGPADVPALVNDTTGETLAFDVTLDAGEELAVDFDRHTATIGAASVRATLLPGFSWWELAPGETTLRLDVDAGSATVDLTARSAWI